ncbi:TadE/TadG family type IV pilus assembly protein [Mesobacillus harenae]|uniref:TadE/TadG family type IV pilus assembly protein n=1 Tax=Mesobacillus harenae TaxID=2213203 RepID=UPI001580C005|nr:TadE family protein [Mesobacillus harenae]
MRKDESGQSMVEMALILPILLLLVVGIFDLGRLIYSYAHLHQAAQETVRVGSLGDNDAEITLFARNYIHLGDASQLQVGITPQETVRHSGDYMTVTLTYPLELFTPLLGRILPSPTFITTDSTIRVE